ncbi:hypothetical protein U9M48_018070 [Paspalum notatum var. saurae]|uniref:Uncharacterized protein n=1 Tax=Paspalum notatum var. saurae TaxID=547442 RepID=A0AAQ3T9W5_PASNO
MAGMVQARQILAGLRAPLHNGRASGVRPLLRQQESLWETATGLPSFSAKNLIFYLAQLDVWEELLEKGILWRVGDDEETNSWNEDIIQKCFSKEDAERILQIPLSSTSCDDFPSWPLSKSGATEDEDSAMANVS